jgi:hypothetical protein
MSRREWAVPVSMTLLLIGACTFNPGALATRFCPFFVSSQMANDRMTGAVTSPAECPTGINAPGDRRFFGSQIMDPSGRADHNVPVLILIFPNSNYPDPSFFQGVQDTWFLNGNGSYEVDPSGNWSVGLGGFTYPQRDSGVVHILTTRTAQPYFDEGYALVDYLYAPQATVTGDKANVFVGDLVKLTLSINAAVYPNATWKWYRDGALLPVTAPWFTQQYASPGSHTFTAVIAASNGATRTVSKSVYWQATGHK